MLYFFIVYHLITASKWQTHAGRNAVLDQRFLHWTVYIVRYPSKHEALSQCWPSVADGGPALNRYWLNVAFFGGNARFTPTLGRHCLLDCTHNAMFEILF